VGFFVFTNRKRHSKAFLLSFLTSCQICLIPLVADATPPTQKHKKKTQKKPLRRRKWEGEMKGQKATCLRLCMQGRCCSCSVTGEMEIVVRWEEHLWQLLQCWEQRDGATSCGCHLGLGCLRRLVRCSRLVPHNTQPLNLSPCPTPPRLHPFPHKLVEKFSVAAQLLSSFDLSLARALPSEFSSL
jgi:hypothetical protein